MTDRFERLLDRYPRPDGRRWGGQALEEATGGAVTRSYVSNLRKGRIGSPGLDKAREIARLPERERGIVLGIVRQFGEMRDRPGVGAR